MHKHAVSEKQPVLLYFTPIDWRWIKQRPQFLAEELRRYFDVRVLYPWQNKRKGLQKKAPTPLRIRPYFRLPTFNGRIKLLCSLNHALQKAQIGWAFRRVKPDIVWLSHPWQWEYLPVSRVKELIYDCMDDYAALAPVSSDSSKLLTLEAELVHRADHIFASSETLRHLLASRHRISEDKIHLIRNGYQPQGISAAAPPERHRPFQIGYVGTVARWFDFGLLEKSLERYPEVTYHLWGPMDAGMRVPENNRLFYHGTINHCDIAKAVSGMDALIMPFQLCDIVQGVDPVKLYEYIDLRKNILCVDYQEIQRFAPFVLFYHDWSSFCEALEQLLQSNRLRYTDAAAQAFLQASTWEKRADEIINHLHDAKKRGMHT